LNYLKIINKTHFTYISLDLISQKIFGNFVLWSNKLLPMQKTTLSDNKSLLLALVPITILIVLLSINVYLFGDNSSGGANQIALLFSAFIAALIGIKMGQPWTDSFKGAIQSISSAKKAIFILFIIGGLAGTWMISGVVPTMIYYGLQLLDPTIFLFASCFISAIISLATGSSWSTIATVGVALLTIGETLGFSSGLTAGAIISGAYFGDKMSPLSDTTNLAPAMAGTDLFTHIRYMMYTTIPSILISLVIFLIIGFYYTPEPNGNQMDPVLTALDSLFFISPILFIVPGVVILLIIKKVDALPALIIGTLTGGVFALFFQPEIINQIGAEISNEWLQNLKVLFQSITYDTVIHTDNNTVNNLLQTGGMKGMINTIYLIVCAMSFGGVMEKMGLLNIITQKIISRTKSDSSLVGSTVFTCIFFNVTASDQYLAIVVPGRMFAKTYKDRGLAPENLSRTLEDSGTVTSVLIPWNTCGVYQSGVLGVSTLTYLPFCFFNLLSPIMTMIFIYFRIKIKTLIKKEAAFA